MRRARFAEIAHPVSWLLCSLGVLFSFSCNDSPVVVDTVTTVTLTPSSTTLDALGATAQFQATIRDQDGGTMSGISVTWQSSNTNVATVSAAGIATAVGVGTTTISAGANGVSGSASLVVQQIPAAITLMEGNAQTGFVGEALPDSLAVEVTDANDNPIPGASVAWSASAGGGTLTGSAETTDEGLAKSQWTLGDEPGTQEAAASVAGLSAVSFSATARRRPAALQIVSGNGQTGIVESILADSLVLLVADAQGQPVEGVTVQWSVDAGNGALRPTSYTTGSDGLAKTRWTLGAEPGVHEATASLEGLEDAIFSATAQPKPVFRVYVTPEESGLWVGSSIQFEAEAVAADGSTLEGRATTWTSSDPAVATVSSTGRLSGVAVGTATVTATVEGVDGTATGHVVTPLPVGRGRTVLDMGHEFSCAVDVSGELSCWGSGLDGRLGNGSTAPRSSPTPVAGSAAVLAKEGNVNGTPSYISVSTGDRFACGLTGGMKINCWGSGSSGQLGDGVSSAGRTSLIPVPVAGEEDWRQVDAGGAHACAVNLTGQAYCWGYGGRGQLGDGGTASSWEPVAVEGGRVFQTISAGGHYTCGLTPNGEAFCWGLNDVGQLGDGSTTDRSTPTPVAGGRRFAYLEAGRKATCGITTTGLTYCWGGGPLGDGTSNNSAVPVLVGGGLTFNSISGSQGQICGVRPGGQVYCWSGYG